MNNLQKQNIFTIAAIAAILVSTAGVIAWLFFEKFRVPAVTRTFPSCNDLNLSQEKIDIAVAEASVGIANPWENENDFRLLLARIQTKLGCVLQKNKISGVLQNKNSNSPLDSGDKNETPLVSDSDTGGLLAEGELYPVSGVTLNKDGFPINTPTQITFRIETPPYKFGEEFPVVTIERISQSGDVLGIEGTMLDDGNVSLGDSTQGDTVFSFQKIYNIAEPGEIWLRIKTDINGRVTYTDNFSLLVFEPLTNAESEAMNSAIKNATQLYWQLLPVKGEEKALADVVIYLKGLPIVKDVGISKQSNSIWIEFTNGLKSFIMNNPPGTKGL